MSDSNFPLDLSKTYFLRSVVDSIPTFDESIDRIEITPVNSLHVEEEPINGQYVATMTTVFNSDRTSLAPYYIEIHCMGTFIANNKNLSNKEIRELIRFTAHNVLYGAIREHVTAITGRHIWGPFTLGLSFLNPVSAKQKEKKEEDII